MGWMGLGREFVSSSFRTIVLGLSDCGSASCGLAAKGVRTHWGDSGVKMVAG